MRAILRIETWEGAEGQSGIGVLLVASNDNRPCSWERIGRIAARVVADAAERIEAAAGLAEVPDFEFQKNTDPIAGGLPEKKIGTQIALLHALRDWD